MSDRSVLHSSFVIERIFDAPPALVFHAYADPAAKRRWFGGPKDWDQGPHTLDFRAGGSERASGGPKGGKTHTYDARYCDIVPNERIVSTYEMYMNETRISVSLATVELSPAQRGTKLVYTEQVAFLDGYDIPAQREEGTRELFNALEAELNRAKARS
jgi:uncharacterized protein YndB with AHSA1/START domain